MTKSQWQTHHGISNDELKLIEAVIAAYSTLPTDPRPIEPAKIIAVREVPRAPDGNPIPFCDRK